MAFHLFNLDGLFNPDDPCLDPVLPAADWGARHPDEVGQAITTAVTAPFGIAAASQAEGALESVRTLNDWFGGVADQADLNHDIGVWAAPPLSALGAWGACHIENAIDGMGAAAPPSGLAQVTSVGSDDWSTHGITAGNGFSNLGENQSPFDVAHPSIWAIPTPYVEPSFVDYGTAPSTTDTTSYAWSAPAPSAGAVPAADWGGSPSAGDWHTHLSAATSQYDTGSHIAGNAWTAPLDSGSASASVNTASVDNGSSGTSAGSSGSSPGSTASDSGAASSSSAGSSGAGGI